MDEAVKRADIFVTATGNADVITADHMKAMKNMAIVSNIGHFDSEIQISALSNYKWTEIKPQVDLVEFDDGKQIIVLAKGRLVNLGRSEEHTSALQSLMRISYAVFCLKKKKTQQAHKSNLATP